MLYMSGSMSKPRRIQAAFVSETELKNVVSFLKKAYEDEMPDEIDINISDPNNSFETIMNSETLSDSDEDDLYEAAREEVIKAGKGSTSYLQRKLSVGYSRAAKLVDMLEERGVVGPGEGSKAREVLIKSNMDVDDDGGFSISEEDEEKIAKGDYLKEDEETEEQRN